MISLPLIFNQPQIEPKQLEIIEVKELTVEEKIINAFPDSHELMLAIANAESGVKAHAYNPEWHKDRNGNKICQGSFGLFQVGCIHTDEPEKLFDVDYNIEKAKEVLDKQGLRAWGVCTNGRVNCGV